MDSTSLDCIIEPRRERGEPLVDRPVLFCINPGEAKALGRLAEKRGAKRHFLYNSNLWHIPGKFGCYLCGPAIGAPMAVMVLEKLIALGAHEIITFGTVGALAADLKIGDVLLPTEAHCDEGTSAHYPINGVSGSNTALRRQLIGFLQGGGVASSEGPLWTTDAPYRETKAKVEGHRDQGVFGVDMEYSALATVAAFREVNLAAVMVVSDLLKRGGWEPGFHRKDFKARLQSVGDLLLQYCSGEGEG